MARDYRRIAAFQRVDDVVCSVYEFTRDWPKEKLYSLTSQVRRAVVSAAANIVEGASRNSEAEYLHFLSIARGSLKESEYMIHLARRLGYVSEPDFEKVAQMQEEANRVLWGLIKAVAENTKRQAPDHWVSEDVADYTTDPVSQDIYGS